MKLIVQIPCLDEAETLAASLEGLPEEIQGISSIQTLVIDDGSHDQTVDVARRIGVDRIVSHATRRGLAAAFSTGIETSLRMGADIIVNTDGDNQYPADRIPQLVAPILRGEADIVIANRQVDRVSHFSPVKKALQLLGSWLVRTVSGTEVPDAPSGFRAYSREAALRLNVLTRFSYTLETIIQAGKLGLKVVSVPVKVNQPTRPSRLQRSTWHFVKAQSGTIIRIYAFYEPLRTFTYVALPFLLLGIGSWVRFLYFYLQGYDGLVQSLTIGTGLFLVGILIVLFGFQADISGKHRQLTQELLYRLKKLELEQRAREESNDEVIEDSRHVEEKNGL